MTVRARPIFSVKGFPSGEPWICIEYWNADEGMPTDLFGFDLPPGTTAEKAREIAQYMQDNLGDFAVTPYEQ